MLKNILVLLTLTTALTATMPRSQADTLPSAADSEAPKSGQSVHSTPEGAKAESTDSAKDMKSDDQTQEKDTKADAGSEVKETPLKESPQEAPVTPVMEKKI
jgi:hypothetical protein